MASPSKEEIFLQLIFEESPLKHWHFEELLKKTKMSRGALNKWLNKYLKEGLLNRIKEKGKFPYFTAGSNNLVYQTKKRIYGLKKLEESGLFKQLMLLPSSVIILFGSMAKGDWYKDSDVDIFIYGDLPDFGRFSFERKLKREIEIHHFSSKKEIKEIRSGLMKNVAEGFLVKGSLQSLDILA